MRDQTTIAGRVLIMASQRQESSENFRPFFIVGCGRSGTTLLSVLIDRHSQVAVTPESHYFRMFAREYEHHPAVGNHSALVDLFSSHVRCADLNLDPTKLLARFEEYPADLRHLFVAALEEYAEVHGAQYVGEKTPMHLENVQQILEWFPDARIVGIVRDGRDVARSRDNVPYNHRGLLVECMVWRWAARECLRCAERYPENFMLMRFEELLTRPEETLRQVMQFIGLELEKDQFGMSVNNDIIPEHELGWKHKARSEIDPSRASAWRGIVAPEEKWLMNAMMGHFLRRFDYPDADMTGCPLGSRIENHARSLACRVRFWPPVRSVNKWIRRS